MAKKNYQKLDNSYDPTVYGVGTREVTIRFTARNSHGTEVVTSIKIEKYMLPRLIKEFARIAKADADQSNGFVQQIKESVA